MAEGFIEKTKGFFGFGAVESYDDTGYDRDEFSDYPATDDRAGGHYAAAPGRHSHDRYAGEAVERRVPASSRVEERHPVEDRRPTYTPAAPPAVPVSRDPELVVVTVDSYRDAGKVTPEAKRGDIVAFNLGSLDKADGNRFLAFVMGVASALDGKLEKLDGVRNFVLLPQGARLTLDVRDALSARLSGER